MIEAHNDGEQQSAIVTFTSVSKCIIDSLSDSFHFDLDQDPDPAPDPT